MAQRRAAAMAQRRAAAAVLRGVGHQRREWNFHSDLFTSE